MKKILLALIASATLFTSTLIIAGTSAASINPEMSVKGLNLMFIQIANQGSLEPIKGKPGFYLLTLKGVNEYVQYFSDRPARVTGLYPTDEFINKWNHGNKPLSFNKMPPNAALSGVEPHLPKNRIVNTVLQLSEPVYNSKNGTLTYTTQILAGKNNHNTLKHIKNVALFIDSYCASCSGQGF